VGSAHSTDGGSAAGPLDAQVAYELAQLAAELTGRRASKARAFVDPDVVVCQLEGAVTKIELSLVATGKGEFVREQRTALMREELVAAVERLTGRSVSMFLSGILGESWVEVFVLDPDGTRDADAPG
jgi:uncharacterized protein YbcI